MLDEKNGYLKVRHHKLSSGVTGWFKKSDVKAYKTGGLVDYTGLAQVDGTPGKPELMLNAEDTENFLELRDALREIALQELTVGSKSANNDYGIDVSPRLTGITDISGKLAQLKNNTVSQSHNITFGDTNINIDKVEDYNDFVTKLRDDPQFEKMILSKISMIVTHQGIIEVILCVENNIDFSNKEKHFSVPNAKLIPIESK